MGAESVTQLGLDDGQAGTGKRLCPRNFRIRLGVPKCHSIYVIHRSVDERLLVL